MSKIRSKELPSNQFFEDGITTRVMAKKMVLQAQRDNEEKHSLRARQNSRQSSKFLSGTSIPNSTIRASLESSKKVEFKEKIESVHSAKVSAKISINNADEEQRLLSEERGLERIRQKIHSSTTKQENPVKDEKKQSNHKPLNIEIPHAQMRRSTLESIKDAIDKSQEHGNKLVNADSIERRNVGQYFQAPPDSNQSEVVPKDESTNPPQRRSIQKQDLQTQTSFLLEKIDPQIGSN